VIGLSRSRNNFTTAGPGARCGCKHSRMFHVKHIDNLPEVRALTFGWQVEVLQGSHHGTEDRRARNGYALPDAPATASLKRPSRPFRSAGDRYAPFARRIRWTDGGPNRRGGTGDGLKVAADFRPSLATNQSSHSGLQKRFT
jgi:hypothetical protein